MRVPLAQVALNAGVVRYQGNGVQVALELGLYQDLGKPSHVYVDEKGSAVSVQFSFTTNPGPGDVEEDRRLEERLLEQVYKLVEDLSKNGPGLVSATFRGQQLGEHNLTEGPPLTAGWVESQNVKQLKQFADENPDRVEELVRLEQQGQGRDTVLALAARDEEE